MDQPTTTATGAGPAGSSAASRTPVVELVSISKAFPGVQANDDVSLSLYAGEIHCLLGENGAGKSTLMGILAGMQQPDSGGIRVNGEPVLISSPRKALDLGIGTVYQHSTLVGALTVVENLILGDSRALRLDIAGATGRLQEFSAMLGVEIDAAALTGDLALGRQ
ncbi:MAG: ATP-binding cassette domain-containing protein, partial [Solirubrobacteraceae bacterium]